ncbi:MAG: hypothetical protein IIZ40_03980 [Bacilli bacterium]|nr:hypothetical protein [Bacilli bacterium]
MSDIEKELEKDIEYNKKWMSHHPFIYNNKETFKNKQILLYCENCKKYNTNDTINFFTGFFEKLIDNAYFIYCGNIDDFIEKVNRFDNINYYFFVEPKDRTEKHNNILEKINIDDNKHLYLLHIDKYIINNNMLFEKITMIYKYIQYWGVSFINRKSEQRALNKDCFDHFINENKDILDNHKILIYNERQYFNRIRTLNFFTELCSKHFNNISFEWCYDLEDFNKKLNDCHILFINQPYNKTDEYNKMMDKIRYKRTYLFEINLDYNEEFNGLYEHIKIDYHNNKNEPLHDLLRFLNRDEDY